MRNIKNKSKLICLLLVVFFVNVALEAQDVETNFQTRTSVEIGFKPIKNFKLNFTPELRFDENFSLDKFFFGAEIAYKPIKLLSLAALYRLGGNLRDNKDTESLSRFALSATASKSFGQFEPSLRLQYTNDADDDIIDEKYLRYKLSVNYDIKKSKITPFIGFEVFQITTNGDLYKMRYFTGVDYKLFKNNFIGLNYKFDYYLNEYKNNHIISLGYKIKF